MSNSDSGQPYAYTCSIVQAKEKPGNAVQADDPISFLQLSSQRGDQATENVFELSLSQALAGSRRDSKFCSVFHCADVGNRLHLILL